MKSSKKILLTLQISGVVSAVCLVLCYIIAYYLLANGLSSMELALMAIMSSVVFFFVILFLNTYLLTYYNKTLPGKGLLSSKWYHQWMLSFIFIFLMAAALDSIYFFLIDDSISKIYAKGVSYLGGAEENEQVLDYFGHMPHFLQNYILNAIAVFFAALFSVLISRTISKPRIKAAL